ncbi:hypothetical protein HFD88_000226 [Aspergillus terreus]|nr:hypothetical protein HFD88_000226 [Aspergillus terreus]
MDIDALATKHNWVHGSMNKPFTLIVALYMSQQTSLDLAVKEIISVINEVYYGGEPGKDLEESLRDIWASILHASRKTPRQDPVHPPDVPSTAQLRLLALLTALQRQPDPVPIPQTNTSLLDMDLPPATDTSIPLDWNGSASNVGGGGIRRSLRWKDLPLFEETVLQALSDEPGRRAGFSPLEVEAWESLVAFLALVAKREVVRLEGVAVAMIRWALEVRHDDVRVSPGEFLESAKGGQAHDYQERTQRYGWEQRETVQNGRGQGHAKTRAGGSREGGGAGDEDDPGLRARLEATRLNVYVAAAALWAIIMGEELWQRRGEEVESPVGLSTSPPSAATSPSPTSQIGKISKSRWNMWIDRLRFLSLREDLTISTRELAAEAAAVMMRVG